MNDTKPETGILDCLRDNYGLDGELLRLSGENVNYSLTTHGGERYVVKAVGEEVTSALLDMQSRAIAHAAAAGLPLNLPKFIENKHGNLYSRIKSPGNQFNKLILQYFIDGKILENLTDISTNLLQNVGFSLAELDLVMATFEHPAAQRSHAWNLLEVGRHRPVISLIEDSAAAELLAWAFDTWSSVAEAANALPRQFIHGDANPENIIVRDGKVSGLVDFGDCGMGPVVCELAICLAYLMMDRDDPLAVALLVTDAYQQSRPLQRAERELLLPLICGRAAVTIAMAVGRRAIDPANPNWFRSDAAAWRLLARLREEPALQM